MRHRIVPEIIGLGNSSPELLNNNGDLNPAFASDALDSYFETQQGFDYQVDCDSVTIGTEPAYQYGKLFLIRIARDKAESAIVRGKAWGPYGSGIAKSQKLYKDYKRNSKFKRFVDKWHPVLFEKGLV